MTGLRIWRADSRTGGGGVALKASWRRNPAGLRDSSGVWCRATILAPPATLCLNPEHHQGVSTGLAGGMIGGAGGALWGGVIGALVRREEWETIQDATPNRFVLSPVVDVRPGRDEGPTTYFGIRVQF